MKKIIAILAAFGVMFGASSVHADSSVKLLMHNRTDGVPVEATTDAEPELKHNRVMVPLRVVSEHLGARVHWTEKEIVLVKSGATIVLRPGSDEAEVNGGKVRLDAAPYVKNGRVMVPLRFVAEVFDCDVRYENRTVTVATKPPAIDGVAVTAFQIETYATMGSAIEHVLGNSHIEALYHAIETGKGEETDPPASTALTYMTASPGDFYPIVIYDFLDQDGGSIRHYEIYAYRREYNEPPLDYHLMYAAHEDRWYKFGGNVAHEIDGLNQAAEKHGYRLMVSNNIA